MHTRYSITHKNSFSLALLGLVAFSIHGSTIAVSAHENIKEYKKPAANKVVGPGKAQPQESVVEQKRKWIPKVTSFAMADMNLTKALVAGDVEKAMGFITEDLEDSFGEPEEYLRESVLPFFADHYRNGNYSPGVALKKDGRIIGFKSYHSFTNRKGKKKYYSFKTIEVAGKPMISAINCGDRIEKEHPDLARTFKDSKPKVEMIEPTPEPSRMWESKKSKD